MEPGEILALRNDNALVTGICCGCIILVIPTVRIAKYSNVRRRVSQEDDLTVSDSPFLSYDLGALSRLYAQEPGVTIGFPYAHLYRWPISEQWAAERPCTVRVNRTPFELRSDRPPDWRRVSDHAFTALGSAGQDLSWSESKIRVLSFDAASRTLSVQRAVYDDQRRSNLVLDYRLPGSPTLREMLRNEYGAKLPALDDNRLANTLGVALLVIVKISGRPHGYCVRRPDTGIAVFQNTWSCTASGAAKWPERDDDDRFYAGIVNDVLEEMNEEVGLVLDDLTFFMPVALSRELVRGGKPELLFVAGCNLPERILKERRKGARLAAAAHHQPQEVTADTLFSSAARFIDLESDPTKFMAAGMSHQASGLLLEARRQLDAIRAHPDWRS